MMLIRARSRLKNVFLYFNVLKNISNKAILSIWFCWLKMVELAHPIPKSTHFSATLTLILLLANEKNMFTTVAQPAFRIIPSNTYVSIVFSSFKLSIFHRYHNLLVNHNKMFHKKYSYVCTVFPKILKHCKK